MRRFLLAALLGTAFLLAAPLSSSSSFFGKGTLHAQTKDNKKKEEKKKKEKKEKKREEKPVRGKKKQYEQGEVKEIEEDSRKKGAS